MQIFKNFSIDSISTNRLMACGDTAELIIWPGKGIMVLGCRETCAVDTRTVRDGRFYHSYPKLASRDKLNVRGFGRGLHMLIINARYVIAALAVVFPCWGQHPC